VKRTTEPARERTPELLFSTAVKGTTPEPMETEPAASPSDEAQPTSKASQLPAHNGEKKKKRKKKKKAKKQPLVQETRTTPETAAQTKVTRKETKRAPAEVTKKQPEQPTVLQAPSTASPSPSSCPAANEEHQRRSAAQQGDSRELYQTIGIICSALERMVDCTEGKLMLSLLKRIVDSKLSTDNGSTAV
jgi:hypothetical protein